MSELIIEYHAEFNTMDFVDKYAERISRIIDEQTLARVEHKLAEYGYVKVVRCGDCDFSHEDELGNLRCHGPLTEPWDYYNDEPSDGVKVIPDGFCWCGKRKEAGDD